MPEENDYSALFERKLSANLDSDDEGTLHSEQLGGAGSYHASPSHGPSMLDQPTYFGLSEARLLAHHLAKKQLPGLTSIEQLELLALADTFATTKVDLEESPGAIERGVQFAKKGWLLLLTNFFLKLIFSCFCYYGFVSVSSFCKL